MMRTKQTWHAGGSCRVFSIFITALRNTLGQSHFHAALTESPWPRREQSHDSAWGTSKSMEVSGRAGKAREDVAGQSVL